MRVGRPPLIDQIPWHCSSSRTPPGKRIWCPVRHGRMMVSPFTFYRGAAKIMAADLKDTPTAGLNVQLCGDAHLSNFGVFASPERALVFDLNDFDETLPGPFEYDVKRMAASFTIAARNNGFTEPQARDATLAATSAYREAMAGFAEMRTMEIWYAHRSDEDLLGAVAAMTSSLKGADKKAAQAAEKNARKGAQKAHTRDSLQALSKLAEYVDGEYRIVSQPPVVIPARDLAPSIGMSAEQLEDTIHEQFRAYRATLQDDRRHLLERFQVVDVARKVVGVGSVGTRAFIVLLQGRDQQDPLFLQVKEATASVLEDHLPKSRYHQPGERVVQGQRMMQAASDIYLGWTKGVEEGRYLYWRQLRDMKGAALVETMAPITLSYLRALLRGNPGTSARPIRRPDRARRLPRRQRQVRPVHRRLLPPLRRPKRPGLPLVLRRDPIRPTRSAPGRLTADHRGRGCPTLLTRNRPRFIPTSGETTTTSSSNQTYISATSSADTHAPRTRDALRVLARLPELLPKAVPNYSRARPLDAKAPEVHTDLGW